MMTLKGVVMTDGINRKNHRIPVETMINAYKKSSDIPMMMNAGHDRTKPIGYTLLDGIYFEPGKAYLTNRSYIAESADDYDLLRKISLKADDRMFREEHVKELKELYSHLGSAKSEVAKIAPTGQAVAVIDKGIVYRVFPELLENQKDGLISLKELDPIYSHTDTDDEESTPVLIPGIYKRDIYILFAHRYMRRNLSYANTINDSFFVEIEKLRAKDVLDIKIAIDPDMIGLLGTENYEVEYQYWWGPKFSDDLSSIPEGVTCHKNQNYEGTFTNITETQFYWHIQDQIRTFECEEICDKENVFIDDESMFGCRYVHSMIGKDKKNPYHLDGAVRIYSDAQMIERMEADNDISKCGKDSFYYKLWRIDGNLDVIDWKELITHYYRDNFLVGEYFGGTDTKFEQIKDEDSDKSKAIIQNKDKYIPVNMNSGDGSRIFYRRITKECLEGKDTKIINHSLILMPNGEVRKYIEADTVTFLKILRKKGINVRIPYSAMIDFGDMVFNFPVIYCKNQDIAEIALTTICDLCKVWERNRDDRLLSFGIAIEDQGDKATQISFAGHIADLLSLLSDCCLKEFDSIDEWVIELYKKICTYKNAENIPDRSNLIDDGRLWFGRRFADERHVKKYKISEMSLGVEIKAPVDDMEHLLNDKIKLAPVYSIKKAICDKCGNDYLSCQCTKFIDKDVTEHIVEADYIGMIWTTRNCYYPDERLKIVNTKKK